MKQYRVLTINPGSTSTKIALFEGETCLFSKNVAHDAQELAKFKTIPDQLPYREKTILDLLAQENVDLSTVDVFVGRGGGLLAMEGGTYAVTELLLEHARTCANGVIHPAALGSQLAHAFAERYGKQAMVVNPPDTDEMQEIARVTGIKGVNRMIHLHALNLKETAIRHSKEVLGKKYEECNYVVCHIGGGVSVSAHRKGRMVDGYDNVGGEGPMAPTRCGAIGVAELLNYIEKNNLEFKDVRKLLTSSGGFVSHVGISDAIEINRRKGCIKQVQKNINMLHTILSNKLIPQIEELKRTITEKGLDFVLMNHPHIEMVVYKLNDIEKEIEVWKRLSA